MIMMMIDDDSIGNFVQWHAMFMMELKNVQFGKTLFDISAG